MEINGIFNASGIGNAVAYGCNEESLLYYVTDATTEKYNLLFEALNCNNYTLRQSGNTDGNLFSVFEKDRAVTVLYTPCDRCIRVSVSADTLLPEVKPENCENLTSTVFYGFENDHTLIDCGMCLLVQCADFSFFVVDSGHYFQFNDNDRIYRFMRERTPADRKVRVCGWLITHGHTDHISKLIDFLKYNTDDVIIEGFYHNLLPLEYDNDFGNHEEKEVAGKLMHILSKQPAPVYRFHTGMKFSIRNLNFEVLYTYEDAYPAHIEDFNDSSVVLMLECEGTRILIPGDGAELASKRLEDRYPNALKSDIVQVAHHGHTGLSAHCYELINADTAVFPVTRIMFEQDIDRHEANRKVCELASRYFITGDGTVGIPLPYDVNGIFTLPDETTEDFGKIRRVWKYEYTDEYRAYIRSEFLRHGGKDENLLIPSSPDGWIEPK